MLPWAGGLSGFVLAADWLPSAALGAVAGPMISNKAFSHAMALLPQRNKSYRQETFDVCFAMFDVSINSRPNSK